jgi:hypothetical protein
VRQKRLDNAAPKWQNYKGKISSVGGHDGRDCGLPMKKAVWDYTGLFRMGIPTISHKGYEKRWVK